MAYVIGSKVGKKLVSYCLDQLIVKSTGDVTIERLVKADETRTFVVIGLGRCGCRVTAKLASMIAASKGAQHRQRKIAPTSFADSLRDILGKPKANETVRLEPIMVIGDLNDSTFADIDGLLAKDDIHKAVANDILRIDYRPLAPNGCGNVPLFGEFFTRGLLALPPREADTDPNPWVLARNYLLAWCSKDDSNTRLAWYVFGAAGGSGSGAAGELMRAQRYAIRNRRNEPDPQVYFTGVAVIPEDENLNDFQLWNAGRLIVQYLAELNLRLGSVEDYNHEPHFDYATHVVTDAATGETQPLIPWDSLGIVSNEVMRVHASGVSIDHSKAEEYANQYIAQLVFNLAAAQSPPTAFKNDEKQLLEGVQFEDVHLDTEDLRNGLRGPFAHAFGVASESEVTSTKGIDHLFVRAVCLPEPSDAKRGLGTIVEGISICPEKKAEYQAKTSRLGKRLKDIADDGSLLLNDFSELSKVKVFRHCQRAVFVLTSPLNKAISEQMKVRIQRLISWTFPSVRQVRFAIIRGTTGFYSLSLYLEGSVVLCTDIRKAVLNYLKNCWKQKNGSDADFKIKFNHFLERPTEIGSLEEVPIPESEVLNWLGTRELYGKNVPDFENSAKSHDGRWQAHVGGSAISDDRKEMLRMHKVDDCFLTVQEVAAALRYLNYINHVRPRTAIDPDD